VFARQDTSNIQAQFLEDFSKLVASLALKVFTIQHQDRQHVRLVPVVLALIPVPAWVLQHAVALLAILNQVAEILCSVSNVQRIISQLLVILIALPVPQVQSL